MMKKTLPLAAALLLAAGSQIALPTQASAGSYIERNAQSGTEHGEISGFSAASPGIAAEGRYRGQSGWGRHRHHRHYYRYYRY